MSTVVSHTTPIPRSYFNSLSVWAFLVLILNILVILWGAFVRISGSGAGCGEHWPLCNGEIIPTVGASQTYIEFFHRITSGLAFFSVLFLFLAVRRQCEKGGVARRYAGYAMLSMCGEVIIGALLVVLRLVENNASIYRVLVMGIHLVNSFVLLGALTLLALYVSRPSIVTFKLYRRNYVGMGLLLLVGVAGAITALGDTLFPPESVGHGFMEDFSMASPLLVQLRVVHPILAFCTALYLWWQILFFIETASLNSHFRRASIILGRVVVILLMLQMGVGMSAIILLLPTWIQVTHLLLATLLWCSYVGYTATVTERVRSHTVLKK